MKTEALIEALAARADAVPRRLVEFRFVAAAGAGLSLGALLMVALFGVRADIGSASLLPMFWMKLLFPSAVAIAAAAAAVRLSIPGARIGLAPLWIALPFALLWLFAGNVLANADASERAALVLGTTWSTCPRDMLLLAAPAFMATFWAMRGLAPTRPALAGATAGLMAGAIGAAVYSLRCPEMQAPFVAVWYVAGIGLSALLGSLLGPRVLRW